MCLERWWVEAAEKGRLNSVEQVKRRAETENHCGGVSKRQKKKIPRLIEGVQAGQLFVSRRLQPSK